MTDTITDLALDDITESPFNPRRTFADIDGLAADIAAHGRVLQPLLVRPIRPNPLRDDLISGHEVVFGHRRLRAARQAGLASVPCMVRELTDEQARRAQISENLQRDDVHPIEEAEGFQALIGQHGVSADQIAEQHGKSRSYVYGRLKLLQAVPKVRDACLKGDIGSESALLVARLHTPKLQEKALAAIERLYRADLEDGGKSSYRAIRDLLNEKFTLELKGAMFDTADALLLPEAGACSACPKRTGNAPEYADVAAVSPKGSRWNARGDRDDDWVPHAGADICTDPDCFDAKKRAHLALQAKALEAKGQTVIAGNKARAAISATGELKGDYVPLAKVRDAIKQVAKAQAKALKGQGPDAGDAAAAAIKPVTIQDPRTGKTVQAVTREALKAAGVKAAALPKPAPSHGSNYEAQQQKWAREREQRQADADARREANIAHFKHVRAAIAGTAPGLAELRAIATLLLKGLDDGDCAPLIEVRGVARFDALVAALDTMDGAELTQLCVDCVLVAGVSDTWNDKSTPDYLLAIATAHQIALAAATPAAPAGKKSGKAKAAIAQDANADEEAAA